MELVIVAHNIRSTHNVGSIFRTCDGFGVTRLHLTGYTPYPVAPDDDRLPHERQKISKQISKTALGAESTVPFARHSDVTAVLADYRSRGFTIAALEQTADAILLPNYTPPQKLALVLGEEIHGITSDILQLCDVALEIPMIGAKESFNVSVAAGIAMYVLKMAK